MDQAKNFAKVTVASVFNDADTSIDLITGDGSKLPPLPAKMVLWNSSDYPDPADAYHAIQAEILIITAEASDTITATRAQEGTDGIESVEGKTYQMAQVITAAMWNSLLGDVLGSGTAVLIDVAGENVQLRQSTTRFLSAASTGTLIEDPIDVSIGDLNGDSTSAFVDISIQNQRFTLIGMDLATDRIESASVAAGTLVGKLAIRDGSGTIIGYFPIHSTII